MAYECRFYPSKVKKMIKLVLEENLNGIKYDQDDAPQLTEDIVRTLREETKSNQIPL